MAQVLPFRPYFVENRDRMISGGLTEDDLEDLLRDRVVSQDYAPQVLIYQIETEGHVQTGILAVCQMDDYRQGKIKKHERIRVVPKYPSGIQQNPIYLFLDENPAFENLVRNCVQSRPPNRVIETAVETYRTWSITDSSLIHEFCSLLAKEDQLYIADGHHRIESLSSYVESDSVLSVIFPSSHLRVFPIHRLLKKISPSQIQLLLEKLPLLGQLRSISNSGPTQPRHLEIWTRDQKFDFEFFRNDHPSDNQELDVSLLRELILKDILEIPSGDPEQKIHYIDGHQPLQKIEDEIQSGRVDIAFRLHPITVNQLITIMNRDEVLPPKSTWFSPKPKNGLIVYDPRDK